MSGRVLTPQEAVKILGDIARRGSNDENDNSLIELCEGTINRSLSKVVVAWITQRKDMPWLIELAEPFEKASNPRYWTDGVPVYGELPIPIGDAGA